MTAFCAAIEETKVARNHVFHGIWGWRGDIRSKTVFPAARKTSNPGQPFKSSQLPGLEKRLSRCSRLGANVFARYAQKGPLKGIRFKYTRFFHHAGKDVPEWLQEWSRRNPVDSDALDRSAKGGQLPRLEVLFPNK